MNQHAPLFLPLLLTTIMAASCGSNPQPIDPATSSTTDTAAVQTTVVIKGRLTTHMLLPAQLKPFQTVDIYAKVNSYVKAMRVDVGSQVHKGDLLTTLEAPELEASEDESASLLHTQEALYRVSKATYYRLYKTSLIPGTVSPNDLDIANARMASDSANLAAARSKYEESTDLRQYLVVRAPFDGVISIRNMYPGGYAGPAGKGSFIPLMTLQEQIRLRLIVKVPELATGYFRLNDTVHFSVESRPGRTFTARVTRLAGALDLDLRTEELQMDVENRDRVLLPGMFADVDLDLTNADEQLLVPATSLTGNSQEIFVIRVNRGRAQWVPVKKGREANGMLEVFGDLRPGDLLITHATDELKDGTPVK
jgi:membrane fusion protein, multidrug efflux system